MAGPKKSHKPKQVPTRQQILDFIERSERPAGKREITKAFGLRGSDKIALKALLKDMTKEGLLAGEPVGKMSRPESQRKPKLYIELRQDGEPMNPLPWLAATETKVSG